MSARVVSPASILVDLAIEVPTLPERGGDVVARAARTEVGGGFNLIAAAARQGVECVYAGPHGVGRYGDLVRAALAAEGVRIVAAPRTDADTGYCVALIEPDAERTFVTVTGVEAQVTAAELDAAGIRPDDVVALSGYDLAYPASGPVLGRWLGTAPPARYALDPGPLVAEIPTAILAAALARVEILTLNQREARLLGDAPDASGAVLLDAVRAVPALNPAALVVVREGAAGCIAAGGALGDTAFAVPAPAVEAFDATGAGDTHTGVLLAELARGTDAVEALRLATLAAAISVTRRGPARAPARAEIVAAGLGA